MLPWLLFKQIFDFFFVNYTSSKKIILQAIYGSNFVSKTGRVYYHGYVLSYCGGGWSNPIRTGAGDAHVRTNKFHIDKYFRFYIIFIFAQNLDIYFNFSSVQLCLWIMETKGFFQFEIIINVFVSSFRSIWIHILWVYGHYKYVYSYSAGIDFRRRNLNLTCTQSRIHIFESSIKMVGPDTTSCIFVLAVSFVKAVWFEYKTKQKSLFFILSPRV